MGHFNSLAQIEVKIDSIKRKGNIAIVPCLIITVITAFSGLLMGGVISIFEDGVFLMFVIVSSTPLLINILYIFTCYRKLRKLQEELDRNK